MIGLLVLGGAAAYVAIFWFVIAKARNRGERISAIAVALLIPFWDFPFGYYNFYRHCNNDGGLHIVSKAPASSAIFVDLSAGYTPHEAVRYGFRTIEYGKVGDVVRYTAEPSGLTKSTHSTPISTVMIERAAREKLPWNLERTSFVAKRIRDGQLIAQQNTYHWLGLWWQVGSGPFFGGGIDCGWSYKDSLIAVIARGTQ